MKIILLLEVYLCWNYPTVRKVICLIGLKNTNSKNMSESCIDDEIPNKWPNKKRYCFT